MSFSFDGDMSSPVNQVRVLTGDTDPSEPQLQDETITMFTVGGPLAAGSIYLAAAQCCEAIASAYARQVNIKIGTSGANLEPRMQHYRARAKDLRRQNVLFGGVVPYSGGISIADEMTIAGNSDRQAPAFSTTTSDNPGGSAGPQPNQWWPS